MTVDAIIWRAVRIITDVGLPQGKMTFDDSVKMLMTEARMSKEGAMAEVQPYTQPPSYQLNYLIGRHLITNLRGEAKRKLKKKYTDKFFNDFIIDSIGCYF